MFREIEVKKTVQERLCSKTPTSSHLILNSTASFLTLARLVLDAFFIFAYKILVPRVANCYVVLKLFRELRHTVLF